MKRININKGDLFGSLEVFEEAKPYVLPSGQKNRSFNCRCVCGKIHRVRLSHLVRGKISSCGCVNKTMDGKSGTDIGILYRSILWRTGEDYTEKHLYYDKGIMVCDEWKKDFAKFEKWCIDNGYRKGLQIDRIENSKGYQPDNCRFVTSEVNCNNRGVTFKVSYKGLDRPLKLLIKELGNPNKYETIRGRILRGWDVEEALFKKPAKNYSNRSDVKKIKQLK